MKSLWYQTFSSMSSDEAEGYPYPKRIKIENNTSVAKEKQQQLEQKTYSIDEYRKSPNKSIYISKESLNFSQNTWRVEKENNGRERKNSMCEFIDFKPRINEKLKCRLLENRLSTKIWNLENVEQNVMSDNCLLNANEHSSEEGLYNIWNVNKNGKNTYELKQVCEQHSTNIAENNKNSNHNELQLNASLSSLNRDLFQEKTSSQKIGTDDKWKEHQLLDVPFLCGINSTFCEIKNKDKNNWFNILSIEENKDNYGNQSDSIEQIGNKEKNATLNTSATLNLFEKIQTFRIPQTDFFVKGNIIKCPNASNTLNSNITTNLKEIEQKNFKHQTYVKQSEKAYCSPNISIVGKQKFQNGKSIVNAVSNCSECIESNHQSVSKQKTWDLAEKGEKASETNFRNIIDSVKCNQMFSKKNVNKKEPENGEEDQESSIYLSIYTYFGSRRPQSGKCSNSTNILKRTWGKVSYKDVTFNIQETIVALISEVLRNRNLNIQYSITELITSINNNSTHIYLQDAISEQQNVNMIKSYLASFSYNIHFLLPAEKKNKPIEKNPLCYRKQIQVNSHINNSLKGNTELQQKYITYMGMYKEIINPRLVKKVGFQLHRKCQKIHYSSTTAENKEAIFLDKIVLFHNQQKVSPEDRCAKLSCLSRCSIGINSVVSVFDSEEKDTKMQLLLANRLILSRKNFDCSSLWKINWCSTNKILTETNVGLLNYLFSISKMKFKNLNNKCSNLKIQVAIVKQKKKKQIKIRNTIFLKEKFKILHAVLRENKKHRSRGVTNSVNFACDATNVIPKYPRTFIKVNFDKNKYGNSREFKKESFSSLPKIPFLSIFDTYEKIPLSADSEEMDQIPLIRQINSNNEKCIKESTVASIKNVHNVLSTSNICDLPEFSTSIVNCKSELLPDSRRNRYFKEINTYSQPLENERIYVCYSNTGSNSGNIFHCFLDNGQCPTSPFYCGPFIHKNVVLKAEEGHCRSSLSNDTEKQCEEMDNILQYQTVRSSEVSNNNMHFKVQKEETMTFALCENVQTDRKFCTLNSKPMIIKQNLEDLQEVGEISARQNYITNKNKNQMMLHGSISTSLILQYSKDESGVAIASGDKLTPHLSIMDNGKSISEFELKSKFDLVLEELCMFHEISKEYENKLPKVETNTIQENPLELNNSEAIDENLKNVSQTKVCISFPIFSTTAGQNITKNNQSSFKGKILNRHAKQEAPHEYCPSSMSDEELLYSPPGEDSNCKNRFPWNPAFLSHSFMKERSNSLQKERGNFLSHEIIRLQPLKTCSGPIRIGLSRKAKPKKLHPYLK
nr:RAD51-associated protein 2 [Pelodiscus sinensis]XP_025034533.1 RAD51-associated protein 2 [Pelodiscus sinensis]|eukprot:XP_025034532.1 RAD51-associated protein 2 [Pelodiscus sinensis]